jgi:thiol-disulfide isomerase/thioredoxin
MTRRLILQTLLVMLFAGQAMAAPPARGPQVGDIPPAQLGEDPDGAPVSLAGYRGKVVVLAFWTSSCGYCLKELPALDALQRQAGDQWLKIVTVNVQDDIADYRAMMRQMRDYALVMTRDASGDIAAGYGVNAYPNLWMIDPQGRIASHHVGYGEDSLNAIIDEVKRLLTIEMERRQAIGASPAAAG